MPHVSRILTNHDTRITLTPDQSMHFIHSLSLLQAVKNSGQGSATRVLLLRSARFPVSSTVSHKSSMLYLTTSVHLFLCLPRLRCQWTSASRIRLTQSSSSLRCICPYHLSLASRTLSNVHATPMMRRMSSFFPVLQGKTNVLNQSIRNFYWPK